MLKELHKEQLESLDWNLINKAKIFALKAHNDTNHFYDKYLPYEFHLRMVVKVAEDFLYLIDLNCLPKSYFLKTEDNLRIFKTNIICAAWNHDTIEDVRVSYNDIKEQINLETAEIVRAVTNYSRGRNRNERMPEWLYKELKETPGAVFDKLCDRIANVQYSKMSGSSMFEKYKKEHQHFKQMLYTSNELESMWNYLENLFVS